MKSIDRGAIRAFFIALGVSIGVPLLLTGLALLGPGLAVFLGFTLLLFFSGAYPLQGVQILDPQIAMLLSTLQMIAFSALFGWRARALEAREQWFLASCGFLVLCVAGWILRLLFGWHADAPRM